MSTDLITVIVALIGVSGSGGLSWYTLRATRQAEQTRQRIEKEEKDREQARVVEVEAYTRARGIDDAVVRRLNEDIGRLARSASEREAHAMETEDRHRREIAECTARALEGERRAERAERRAEAAELRAAVAERAVAALTRRLEVIESNGGNV